MNIQIEDFKGNYKVNILNQFGQTVMTKANSKDGFINVSTLNNGLYIIQVVSGNKLLGNAKFSVLK